MLLTEFRIKIKQKNFTSRLIRPERWIRQNNGARRIKTREKIYYLIK